MVFSSIEFIYYFLPIILVIYYLTPGKFKNFTLMMGSLVFYFVGEPKYIVLLLASTVVDFYHSKRIVKYEGTKKAKHALIQSIVINLSMLGFFKYADFFIATINKLFNLNFELLNLSLPIGISFFTFQTMSYTIDVYRKNAPAQKSIVNLGTYVTLFPQLIAGPIVRYNTLAEALNHRVHSFSKFSKGVERFIIGLIKKILIANVIGESVEIMSNIQDSSILISWLIAVGYAIQIYFDFSGYSDMAIGLGLFFGFEFMENFNYPYVSKSITEFWRRWHISLGQWFKDYVYIPLGGNKVSSRRWLLNILVVWLLTGLWHGAHWNYVLWGLCFGVILIIEKTFILRLLKKMPNILRHLYVLILIIFSFVIFKNEEPVIMMTQFKNLLGLNDLPLFNNSTHYYFLSYYRIYLLAILATTPFLKNLWQLGINSKYKKLLETLKPIVLMLTLLLMTGYLVDASFNPFLYFRF